jgi:hypothetical protein
MERFEFLNGLFLQRHKLLTLRHDYNTSGTIYREAGVKCVSSTALKMISMKSGTVEYALEIPAAFWRSAEATSASAAVTTSTQTYTVAALTGGNAPVSDSLIRVKGAFSGMTITDVATGSMLQLIGAVTSTQYIIIDPATWTATKVTSDTWNRFSAGASDYSLNVVSNRGFGSQFIMEPLIVGGALAYQITLSASAPASSPVVEVRAKKAFL